MRKTAWAIAALAVAAFPPALAEARVQTGSLTCEVADGPVLLIAAPKVRCVFTRSDGQTEAYRGRLHEVGLSFARRGRGVIAWNVFSDRSAIRDYELAGAFERVDLGGRFGSAGGSLLWGGARSDLTLVPSRVDARFGLNLAVGVTSLELEPKFLSAPIAQQNPDLPDRPQPPPYGCGSYTQLLPGQTLSGLSRACGVSLAALLSANPDISNVRDISAGTIINIPDYVEATGGSPCGQRTVLRMGETLDEVAARCRVTLNAIVRSNPEMDVGMPRVGTVVVIPARGEPSESPPVAYENTDSDVQASVPSRPRVVASQQRLEDTCVEAAVRKFPTSFGTVRKTESHVADDWTLVVSMDVGWRRATCEVTGDGKILYLSTLSEAATADPTDIAEQGCLAAVAKQVGISRSQVSTIDIRSAETGLEVMVDVPEASAPWSCRTTADGRVQGVMFTGNDGDGPAPQASRPSQPSDLPIFSAQCPTNLAVDADRTGIVRINGQVASLRKFNDEYYEANRPGVTIGIAVDPSGVSITYTGRNGANGVCEVGGSGPLPGAGAETETRTAPSDLADFVGAKGGQAEMGLANLGYVAARTKGLTSFWWNDAARTCVKIVTADGRYASIDTASRSDCGIGSGQAASSGGGGQSSGNPPPDLADFVGAKGGQAEMGLANLGYVAARTKGLTTFWWNEATRTCVKIVTADGRYASIDTASRSDCGQSRPTSGSNQGGDVATKACLAAVSQETGERNVAVLSSDFSEANTLVMVGVGPQRAPWKCLVSSDGVIAEVSSATDEGAL